jgi:hypothetical protein
MNTINNTNEKYQVVNFVNEEGFKDGFYVLEVNTDNHVVWQSECFATEQEAINEMNSL